MFRFEGPITMGNAQAALVAVRAAIDGGESSISLDALGRSDSSAVAVLIAATRYAEAAGRTLRWSSVPDAVASLARLYGVDPLIDAPAVV
jgi:phospholipid transport system transporter-binding protein